MVIATVNPASGKTLKTFEPLTDAVISAKLESSQRAFEKYRKTPMAQRSQWLQVTAEILEQEKERFGAKRFIVVDAIADKFEKQLVEKFEVLFSPHDQRYRYSAEWIRVVKALWSGERVNFDGEYFHIRDLNLLPGAIAQPTR